MGNWLGITSALLPVKKHWNGDSGLISNYRSDDAVGCEDIVQLAALLIRALGASEAVRGAGGDSVMPRAGCADRAEPFDHVDQTV